MAKARKKAMRLKAAHAHSFPHSPGTSTPTSLSVPPSPHHRHSETSSPPPTPLIGPNPPGEISSELNMLADLYQGDDQPAGETYLLKMMMGMEQFGCWWKHIKEYLSAPPVQWITYYRTYTFLIWRL